MRHRDGSNDKLLRSIGARGSQERSGAAEGGSASVPKPALSLHQRRGFDRGRGFGVRSVGLSRDLVSSVNTQPLSPTSSSSLRAGTRKLHPWTLGRGGYRPLLPLGGGGSKIARAISDTTVGMQRQSIGNSSEVLSLYRQPVHESLASANAPRQSREVPASQASADGIFRSYAPALSPRSRRDGAGIGDAHLKSGEHRQLGGTSSGFPVQGDDGSMSSRSRTLRRLTRKLRFHHRQAQANIQVSSLAW